MNILQVISSFPPAYAYGGALKVAYELSKQLVRNGHGITVYTTDVYNANSRFKCSENPTYIDGIKVHRFRNISNKLAHNNLPIAPATARALKRNITDFDVVHIHEYRSLQAMAAHHYARKRGIPYVLQAHGSLPRIMAKQRLKNLYDSLWGYRLLKDASKVIALTETEAVQCKSMGVNGDKIGIVPNGIDLSEFENLPKRGEFRKKWRINDGQKIILYLGRIHKIKGLDLLAKAFAGLSKKLAEARLVIVGPDDGYLSSLKKLIADLEIGDKALFTGPLYGQEKLEAYVDADVHVSPRAWEPFGLTLIESCACGTPVICSKGCGIADLIDGKVGLAVPYDKDQLSNAIMRMLGNDKMTREFGENGKLLVREQFNWSKIAEQVENTYEECRIG